MLQRLILPYPSIQMRIPKEREDNYAEQANILIFFLHKLEDPLAITTDLKVSNCQEIDCATSAEINVLLHIYTKNDDDVTSDFTAA